VRAPRVAMMRRRKQVALLPVLPLTVDPVHLLVEMKVLQGAKIKRIREEEEEGQGDNEEMEEDEQPPPPPENTRKIDSRKKSKRGRKSR